MNEIKALRRQVDDLKVFEQRYQHAEAARKVCEERNQLLSDSAPLGIFTVDRQGSITGINRKMRELLSWSSDDQSTALNPLDCQTAVSTRRKWS